MNNSPWSKAELQIRAPTKCWIEIHNLKGLFLSCQKILKLVALISCLGGYSLVDPISTILQFSESLERDLSNGIIKVHI